MENKNTVITPEEIEAEGWKRFDLTTNKSFAYRYGVPKYRSAFTKENFFISLDTRKPHIEIIAADVTKIDWLPEFPEHFRITIPCPTIADFRYITKLLNV